MRKTASYDEFALLEKTLEGLPKMDDVLKLKDKLDEYTKIDTFRQAIYQLDL
jgi:hypothetical protein